MTDNKDKDADVSPDLRKLPDWVRWIAQDADGTWWAYEHEPNMSDSGWYENEVGQSLRLGRGLRNADWQHAIQAIK